MFFFNNVVCYKWGYIPTSRVWPTVHEHVQWHRRRWEVHTKDLNCWSINLLRLGRFIDGIYVDSPWWNPSFPYFSDKSPEESLRVYGKLMGIGVTSLGVYKFQGFICLLYPLVNIYLLWTIIIFNGSINYFNGHVRNTWEDETGGFFLVRAQSTRQHLGFNWLYPLVI